MGVRSMQQGQAKLHPCHLAAQDGRAKDSLRGLVVEGSLQDGLQGVGWWGKQESVEYEGAQDCCITG